jgi:hypothetical protein
MPTVMRKASAKRNAFHDKALAGRAAPNRLRTALSRPQGWNAGRSDDLKIRNVEDRICFSKLSRLRASQSIAQHREAASMKRELALTVEFS